MKHDILEAVAVPVSVILQGKS